MTAAPAPCYLCGAAALRPLFALEGGRHVRRCRECGLIGVYPQPTAAEVDARYEPSVFAGCEDELSLPTGRRKRELFERALRIARQQLGRTGHLLDFGCGMGAFLKLARQAGFDVCGLDISRHAVEHVRATLGCPAHVGALADSGWPGAHFDVVTLWDVLHVVPDPLAVLRELRPALRDDGVLVVKVINANGLIFRLARAAAAVSAGRVAAPMRLTYRFTVFHFSPATLRRMLERAGFDVAVLYLESHKDFRTLCSKSWGARWAVRQTAATVYRLGRWLGMEEEIVAFARPRPNATPGV